MVRSGYGQDMSFQIMSKQVRTCQVKEMSVRSGLDKCNTSQAQVSHSKLMSGLDEGRSGLVRTRSSLVKSRSGPGQVRSGNEEVKVGSKSS